MVFGIRLFRDEINSCLQKPLYLSLGHIDKIRSLCEAIVNQHFVNTGLIHMQTKADDISIEIQKKTDKGFYKFLSQE